MEYLNLLIEWFQQYGIIGLAILSFAEASFFPIPPDVILIPLSMANPQMALVYGTVTSVFSVLGALFGWFLGKAFGRKILIKFFKEKRIQKADQYFTKYGGQTLAFAAFTPIPFKIFTILSGTSDMRWQELVKWSLIGRSARFLFEAVIIMAVGKNADLLLSTYFGWITLGIALVVIVGVLIYKKWKMNMK